MIDKDNPLGILSIDHLEFCCENLNTPTKDLFYNMGFLKVAQTKNRELFTQGQIRFLISAKDKGHDREYFKKHGEGVSTISFLVKDAEEAISQAIKRGAKLAEDFKVREDQYGLYKTAAIYGVGDILNQFVERPKENFRPEFTPTSDTKSHPLTARCSRIDHLTNNVPKGEMEKWVDFYQSIYGFKTTRYFDIKGEKTGLLSKVVQLKNGSIIIPINEPDTSNGKSQIQEFIDLHKGAGVQHIACSTAKIIETISQLRERGIKFLKIPKTYYQDIPNRGFSVDEEIETLEKLQLLVDGDEKGYLIQIFSKTYIGPLFFEIIQRKNHFGFGEGNFQALFDAIEREQTQRGYLNK